MNEINSKKSVLSDIYKLIYNSREISRKQIAEELGLSLPTITNHLQYLMDEEFIYMDGTLESTGGRKANTYKCSPSARYSVGLDITRNHMNLVLIDLLGKIKESRRLRVSFEDTDEYYYKASSEIEKMLKESGIERKLVLGVGISLPAIIDHNHKTITYVRVLEMRDHAFERIGRFINYPYFLFNDANSAGLAEWWQTHNSRTAVYLALNPSVGGATINGKNLHTGDNNRASEFGHITIVPGGRRCYCGRKGCVDAYCSENVLTDFTDGNITEFFEKLEDNQGYQSVFDQYLDHLALAVNTLRVCYDSEVIIGGHVGAEMGEYIEKLKEKTVRLNPFETDAEYIRQCQYKTAASAVGAALYFVNKFITNI